MRISFVLPYVSRHGGVRIVGLYAAELIRRGHKVQIVSTPRQRNLIRNAIRFLKGNGSFPGAFPSAGSFFDGLDVVHTVLSKFRPVTDADISDGDVVIATWWETAEWVSRLSNSKGRKFYLIQHDERVFHPNDSSRRSRCVKTWFLPLQKIVVSRWLENLMKQKGANDVCLIPNPIDVELFFPIGERHRNEKFRIGFFYSPSYSKGTDLILSAIRVVLCEVPEIQVAAFGFDSPVRGLPLPARAEYFASPQQAKLRDIYSSCDAWIFGSRSEGYGLPIIEAMACGTPVIAVPTGAAPDLVPKGGGVLLRSTSSEEIVLGLKLLMSESSDSWKNRSNAGIAEAKRHSITIATDAFLAATVSQ